MTGSVLLCLPKPWVPSSFEPNLSRLEFINWGSLHQFGAHKLHAQGQGPSAAGLELFEAKGALFGVGLKGHQK